MSKIITIRVDDDEKEAMEIVAGAYDMSLSAYIRNRLNLKVARVSGPRPRAVRLTGKRGKQKRKNHVQSI